tara:strand:- start:416 stop:640 length:225 start_codon:yes stop_codon:yes gene_type:complete
MIFHTLERGAGILEESENLIAIIVLFLADWVGLMGSSRHFGPVRFRHPLSSHGGFWSVFRWVICVLYFVNRLTK